MKIKNIIKKINLKYIFLLVSFFVSVMGVFTIFLGLYAQKSNYYEFYLVNKGKDIYIDEISVGDSIVNLEDYTYINSITDKKSGKLKLDTDNSLIYSIKISNIDNLSITFSTLSDSNLKIVVKKNGNSTKTININKKSNYSYVDNTSTLFMLKMIINSLKFYQIIASFVLFIIFYLITYLSIIYIYKFILEIKNNNFSISKYIISLLLLFVVNILYLYLLLQLIDWLAIFPMLFILILIMYYLRNQVKEKLCNSFLIISMFIGILYLFIFPPLHVPDEFSHFVKAYQSSYVLGKNWEKKDEAVYVSLPVDMQKFLIKYGSQTLNSNYRLQPRTYLYDIFKITNYNKHSKKYTWYSLKYSSSITYIPGVIMSLIARIISLPIMLLYLLSKLFTICISILMCYFAIKVSPHFKKIFFIVSLLPIFFQQSAGFNVDWLTNSTSILLISVIFREIYSTDKISIKSIAIIIILSIILGFCKFGYFPISFLITLISVKRLHNKSNFNKKVLLICIALITLFISIGVTLFYRNLSAINFPNSISNRNCISFLTLFEEPLTIISIIIKTFFIRLDLDLFRGMVTGFGWSTVWTNSLFLFISLFILILIILCKDENNVKLTKKQYITIFIAFLCIFTIIYAAMLFGWTEVGSNSIDGLQPRYFIPPIALLYILLQNNYISLNLKNHNYFYSIAMIIINVFALLTIINGFYI